ncbi:MAG: hypothetical protein KF703_13325 [Actinobacteria bacterium]|nr:hypothetical protein [Actinomycetota bacterium]
MNPVEAARLLDVGLDDPWDDVRRAYRAHIRAHHPDRAGPGSSDRAAGIIEAYAVLVAHRTGAPGADATAAAARPTEPPARAPLRRAWTEEPLGPVPGVARVDDDTLALDAPADETFRWLTEAANDIGEITYVDRSVPILEVLCRFEGEPATSLVITLQGRNDGTEAFCTAESIEARPAPPTAAVVDLLELALRRRQEQ